MFRQINYYFYRGLSIEYQIVKSEKPIVNNKTKITMKKIFYGWWVLAALFLIYAASNGIGLNTLPIFLPELMKTFDLDQSKVTALPGLLFLVVAMLAPFAGGLLDRFSARLLLVIGGVGMVGCMILLSQVQSYGMLVAFYVLYALFLTLAGIIPSMYIINQWFHKYKGLAMGLFLIASSFGGAIFPQIAGRLIESSGWQASAWGLAMATGVFVLIPLLVIRNRPADVGTYPDGIPQAAPSIQNPTGNGAALGVSLREAMRTQGFYLLLIATGILWFCITGFIQNQGLYLRDQQLGPVQSGNVMSAFFISSILGKLLFGYLSDHFDKKNIMLLSIANLLLGSVLLKMSVQNPGLLFIFAIVFGIGFSGAFTMIQVLVAYLYSGRAYGSILGMVTMVDTLAGSAGIIVLGNMRKAYGSYEPAFDLLIALCVIALGSTYLVRRPMPPKTVKV